MGQLDWVGRSQRCVRCCLVAFVSMISAPARYLQVGGMPVMISGTSRDVLSRSSFALLHRRCQSLSRSPRWSALSEGLTTLDHGLWRHQLQKIRLPCLACSAARTHSDTSVDFWEAGRLVFGDLRRKVPNSIPINAGKPVGQFRRRLLVRLAAEQ